MTSASDLSDLFEGAPPAVLTTYRSDGSAVTSPVWVRRVDAHLEVVITAADPKVGHLRHDPRCALVVFETVPPFRGVEARGPFELVEGDYAAEVRSSIAPRYLGATSGARFAAARRDRPSVVLRLSLATARQWDLAAIV